MKHHLYEFPIKGRVKKLITNQGLFCTPERGKKCLSSVFELFIAQVIFMNKSFCVLALALLLLTGCTQVDVNGGGVSGLEGNDVIKIGFIGPLTGDGAVWGVIEKNAIEIAVKEVNAKGGINGKKLEILYEDGKCQAKDALDAAKRLVEIEGVSILLVSCSQEILPIVSFTEEKEVIVFGSYSMSSQISDAGDFVFRNSYNNKDYAQVIAETIPVDESVGIITEVTDFSSDLRNNFMHEFEKRGGQVVVMEDFAPGEKEVLSQVTKLIRVNPNAILVNPTGPATGIPILRELRQQGYEGRVYGNFFGGSKEVQKLDESQGMIYFADPLLQDSEVKRHLFTKYYEAHGEYPDLEYPAAARYDAVHLLANVMRIVGEDTRDIRNYLYALKYSGALGVYSFDENGDVAGVVPSARVIENGESLDLG